MAIPREPNDTDVFTLAYNTNGLAHHRPVEALRLVRDLGYRGLALTPDVGQLDPYRLDAREVREFARVAEELGMGLAIETGARFALDPVRKHGPNLCDEHTPGRSRRVDYYRRCVDLAHDVGASVVSLWAGAAPGGLELDGERSGGRATAELERVLDRLADGLARVARHGTAAGVTVAFEPEPGMFVTRPAGYGLVRDRVRQLGERLALTLDVGHCAVTGDVPVSGALAPFAADLAHVHLADCPRGRHEHVPIGSGDLDLAEALGALRAAGFRGLAAVEQSRDSHRGPDAARGALAVLRRFTAIS